MIWLGIWHALPNMLTFLSNEYSNLDRQCTWFHLSRGAPKQAMPLDRFSYILCFPTSICFLRTWNEFLSTSNTMHDVVEPHSDPSIGNLNKSTVFEQMGRDGVSDCRANITFCRDSTAYVFTSLKNRHLVKGFTIFWHYTWLVSRRWSFDVCFVICLRGRERARARCYCVARRGRNDAPSGQATLAPRRATELAHSIKRPTW